MATAGDGAQQQQGQASEAADLGRVKRRLRPALTALSLAFVAWASWDLVRRWEGAELSVRWLPAVLAVLPLLAGSLVQGYCWIRLIDRMSGRRVPRAAGLALYLESQLARYLPGKLGLPLVRMAGAARLGVAAGTVGSSVLVEMLSWTAVGSTLGLLLLSLTSEHTQGVVALLGRVGPVLLAGSAALVLALLGIDRRRLPARLLGALKLGGRGPLVPPSVPLLHAVYFSSWGAHGFLLTRALGAEPAVAVGLAGLFMLAPVAGFVVLAAPAGVGVREAVLAVGLVPAVGPAAALAAAILSRAASVFADLGSWLGARGLEHRRPDRRGYP